MFDGVFIRRMYPNGLPADPTANKEATGGQGKSWRHEDGSVRMLRYLIASNSIDLSQYGLDECDVLFIEEVINGTPEANRRGRNPKKFFLYGTNFSMTVGHCLYIHILLLACCVL